MNSAKKGVVIVGPTASGKSALSICIAKKFNGEIISADSRQVYKGLNIGTGKVTKKEMAGVRHHMLDVTSPKKRFTVVQFTERARKNLFEIFSRGKLPIICGGTGFYISALVDGTKLPDVPPDNELRKQLGEKSAEVLFEELQKIDPKRAETIDRYNRRRVIRAIEIARALGKVPPLKSEKNGSCIWIGLRLSPSALRTKIERRLKARLKAGMIKEAVKLHKAGLSYKRMFELGLEYRYLALYLSRKITKEELTAKLSAEIWHYARRQMTWFKKDERIRWFDPAQQSHTAKILSFLRERL